MIQSPPPDYPPPGSRVAIGMSGGLDSSVVASLLQDRGLEVIGLTLHMFKEGSRCCSLEDVERARRVCDGLGMRHYVLNAVDHFEEQIITPFIDSYLTGRTPSPCVLCNQHIKFGTLQERALQLGCTHVGTGHYVKRKWVDGAWRLLRAADAKKDQSYFLHRLSQEQLSRCLFPLEGWQKAEAAAYAEERNLPISTSTKAESQDLCFVSDDGHGKFVEEKRPDAVTPGAIVDGEEQNLGAHRGIHNFTIGQRKGLGVASSQRLYVKALDADDHQVVLAPREDVQWDSCVAEQVHWICPPAPTAAFECDVRIRYRHKAVATVVTPLESGALKLSFLEPQFAVTPGQAAVLYRGDEVLGGGWISNRTDVS